MYTKPTWYAWTMMKIRLTPTARTTNTSTTRAAFDVSIPYKENTPIELKKKKNNWMRTNHNKRKSSGNNRNFVYEQIASPLACPQKFSKYNMFQKRRQESIWAYCLPFSVTSPDTAHFLKLFTSLIFLQLSSTVKRTIDKIKAWKSCSSTANGPPPTPFCPLSSNQRYKKEN